MHLNYNSHEAPLQQHSRMKIFHLGGSWVFQGKAKFLAENRHCLRKISFCRKPNFTPENNVNGKFLTNPYHWAKVQLIILVTPGHCCMISELIVTVMG